jgi:hypothetical protein
VFRASGLPLIRGWSARSKTYGIADLLREAIRPSHPRLAFIFGSIAKDRPRRQRCGRARRRRPIRLWRADECLPGLAARIGRTISVKVFRNDEYLRD